MNSIDRNHVERVRRMLADSEAVDYEAISLAGALAQVGRLQAAVSILLRVIDEPDRGLPGDPVDVLADMVHVLAERLGTRSGPWGDSLPVQGAVASTTGQAVGEFTVRLAASIDRWSAGGER